MKIVHAVEKIFHIERELKSEDQLGFLLTNNTGGFLWLGDQPDSRYQGWFFMPEGVSGRKMFKVVEDIEAVGAPPIDELKNNFWGVERKRGKLIESFFVPENLDALVYETSARARIDLSLDVREFDDHGEWERHYETGREDGCIVIRYTHPDMAVKEVFLAVKTDGSDVQARGNWVRRRYRLDERRKSPPYERYIFKAVSFEAKKMAMAVGATKEEAKDLASRVFEHSNSLKQQKKRAVLSDIEALLTSRRFKSKNIRGFETLAGCFCALSSLNSLLVKKSGIFGLYAGLPWFFQFWNRDEAVCLKGLGEFRKENSLKIFWRQIDDLEKSGFRSKTADEAGWLFKRARFFAARGWFDRQGERRVFEILEKTIDRLLAEKSDHGFALNGAKETWADSLPRAGARIEIQALRLAMYRLAFDLATDPRKKERYALLEKDLLSNVRRVFWDGKFLADGFDPKKDQPDQTIRPNIFLAAYLYPKLLEDKDWATCFENILPKLWLDWGGLATVDISSPEFHKDHTGEDPASYHNGDSWFYLNNIAAIAMHRLDSRRFDYYVKKIFEASSYDLLWSGVLGFAAELSPAGRFDSAGSPAQAWSSATFLELILEAEESVFSAGISGKSGI